MAIITYCFISREILIFSCRIFFSAGTHFHVLSVIVGKMILALTARRKALSTQSIYTCSGVLIV